jgi:hypothetical protein
MKPALRASLLVFFFCFCSCSGESNEEQHEKTASESSALNKPATIAPIKGCKACHSMNLDSAHNIKCTICHNGKDNTEDKETGHEELIKSPSHPDHMMKTCGQCHEEQVENSVHSLHFTLKNEVNLVRKVFGAKDVLQSLSNIPIVDPPETISELADDLLRRRCLRCHPYFSGDRYPAVVRGTGCASCHLTFYEGKLVSHSFIKTPGDSQCLQCHYGNWVGYDYYGRYEHDMNDEYRTPYTTKSDYFRPFGVEFHQLTPDIHQLKGLVCVDCHRGNELMTDGGHKIRCDDCHDRERIGSTVLSSAIQHNKAEDNYSLISAKDEKLHLIPFMQHSAHEKYKDLVGCQVCHAQWTFNDKGTHLMRNDLDEYEDFSRLTVQGSFEVEKILKNNLDFDNEEIDSYMNDKITGVQRTGLWYKGYETRRWEQVSVGRGKDGRLQVMRPLLDLYLSWIDEDEDVRFNSIPANVPDNGLVPYVPHTTGKAGLHYQERIRAFLDSEKKVIQ